MSQVFQDYSNYYDLLNTGKDYARETGYLLALAKRHGGDRPLRHILNLGCGTGAHDLLLAAQGYQVTGVDRSATMLAIAKRRLAQEGVQPAPVFLSGDITTLALGQEFDLALSLFHVLSYQVSNQALRAAMRSAATHLTAGGLFIFDFWYGPAVLHEKPIVRVKRIENDEVKLRRLTEPVLHENANTVEVNFEVDIISKKTGTSQTLHETHLMRYLFLPEVIDALEQAGLEFITAEEWLSGHTPGLSSWNVCCVARKIMG